MSFLKITRMPLLAMPRSFKCAVVMAVDLVLSLASVWVAFYLGIDQIGLPQLQQGYVYLIATILTFLIFVRLGLYRAIFRYTGMELSLKVVYAA